MIPFVSEPLLYLGAIATGALLTGVVYAVINAEGDRIIDSLIKKCGNF